VFVDEMVMRQSPGVVPVAAGESGRVVPLPALAAPPRIQPRRQRTSRATAEKASIFCGGAVRARAAGRGGPGIPHLFAALLEAPVVETTSKELTFPAGNGMKFDVKVQVGAALTAPVP
jgi:hypothetical protein